MPGPNTVPSKRIPCIHTFEQSMDKRTKINVRIQMRQLHKLDFPIVNLFFFFHFLRYISEMFSSISESCLARGIELSWEYRPLLSTESVLTKCVENLMINTWIKTWIANQYMNEWLNEWWKNKSSQFLWTWFVTLSMKPYLSPKPLDYLKGTCQNLLYFTPWILMKKWNGFKGKIWTYVWEKLVQILLLFLEGPWLLARVS